MLFINEQTNKQSYRQTNANDYITSAEGGGNLIMRTKCLSYWLGILVSSVHRYSESE